MTINQPPCLNRSYLVTAITCSFLTLPVYAATDSADATGQSNEAEAMLVIGQTYRNTATKTSLTPEDTPQSISVIDSNTMKNRGVSSLTEALRYAPGITSEIRGGAVTMYDTFNIRGFDAPQSYYDGLLIQLLKGWNLQPQIDPIALQQVEVFKGPTSVLYGSMPPGGMVNMIAKAPQLKPETDLNVGVGAQNLREVSIDSTGQIGDSDLSYRVIALSRKKDSQVDDTQEERQMIAPSVRWQISDKTFIDLNLYYQDDPHMGINSAMPASGMFLGNANGSTSPSTFVGDKNWNNLSREFWLAGYKLNHEFSLNWSFLQSLRYMDASLTQRNTYHTAANFDESTGTLSRNIYTTDENSYGLVVDNQLSGIVYSGDVTHSLLFGLDYQRLDGNSTYQEYSTSDSAFYQFNLFTPDNDLLNPGTLSTIYAQHNDISVRQTGLYFQDQAQWDHLVLIGGGRFDHYQSVNDLTTSGTTTSSEADHHAFSYRVGALYAFDNGLSPYVSYATSFEPVAGKNTSGNAFTPEKGKQIEAGLKYEAPESGISGSASYFHIVKSDVLVADPNDPTFQNQVQLGEITSQGVELVSQLLVNPQWDVSANYTWMDMEVTRDTTNNLQGKTPIRVPEHRANLSTNYHFEQGKLAGTRVTGGVRYVGSMQIDAANSGKVPDYTLVDLSVGYDLQKLSPSLAGAKVNLVTTNVFNQEYSVCYDRSNCWYGAERTVELNMNYHF